MARRTATIKKNQERAVIIGAGITENGISLSYADSLWFKSEN